MNAVSLPRLMVNMISEYQRWHLAGSRHKWYIFTSILSSYNCRLVDGVRRVERFEMCPTLVIVRTDLRNWLLRILQSRSSTYSAPSRHCGGISAGLCKDRVRTHLADRHVHARRLIAIHCIAEHAELVRHPMVCASEERSSWAPSQMLLLAEHP